MALRHTLPGKTVQFGRAAGTELTAGAQAVNRTTVAAATVVTIRVFIISSTLKRHHLVGEDGAAGTAWR